MVAKTLSHKSFYPVSSYRFFDVFLRNRQSQTSRIFLVILAENRKIRVADSYRLLKNTLELFWLKQPLLS